MHDLRAPLRAARGYARIIEEEALGSGPALGVWVGRLGGACGRMERLLGRIAEFAEIAGREPRLRDVDTGQVVAEALAAVLSAPAVALSPAVTPSPAVASAGAVEAPRPDAGLPAPRVRIDGAVRIDGLLPRVQGDPRCLGVAVRELLANALTFVEPGAAPDVVVAAGVAGRGMVRIEVLDRGIGVDARHTDAIFLPFRRLHGSEQYPGSGLGLAMVRCAMSNMRGSCGALARAGGGTCFWIELGAPRTSGP